MKNHRCSKKEQSQQRVILQSYYCLLTKGTLFCTNYKITLVEYQRRTKQLDYQRSLKHNSYITRKEDVYISFTDVSMLLLAKYSVALRLPIRTNSSPTCALLSILHRENTRCHVLQAELRAVLTFMLGSICYLILPRPEWMF